MDENKDKIHISEAQQPHDFALDDILAEFGGAPETEEEAAQRLETLGDRDVALCRELTKLHEEAVRTTLSQSYLSMLRLIDSSRWKLSSLYQ